jgi:hypothetical protein
MKLRLFLESSVLTIALIACGFHQQRTAAPRAINLPSLITWDGLKTHPTRYSSCHLNKVQIYPLRAAFICGLIKHIRIVPK